MRHRRLIGFWILYAVMFVLFAFGVGKLLNVVAFVEVLKTWAFVPHWSIATLGLLIPTAESVVTGAWLVGVLRRPARLATIGLLLLFSTVYLLHVIFADVPECGCLGVLERIAEERQGKFVVLGRNAGLVACLVIGQILVNKKRVSGATS